VQDQRALNEVSTAVETAFSGADRDTRSGTHSNWAIFF
jgi:hypothetical protein